MILADTDVLIDYLAGIPAVTARIEAYIAQDRLATTVITCFELLSGTREGHCGDRLRRFVAALPALPLDRDAAGRAAAVRQRLERAGSSIGMGDSLIAGIALTHGVPLWTRNRKHFERVEALQLVAEENG
jgi:predicted nucleic acid-binding protein